MLIRKRTHEEFIKEVFDLVGDEYVVLNKYVNIRTKVKIKHNKCEYAYDILPNAFTKVGNRCANCSGKRTRKLTHDEFVERVHDAVGDEYSVIGTYIKSSKPIEILHRDCGHVWKVRPNNFIHHGHRCPKCSIIIQSKNKTKSHEQFCEEVLPILGEEYEILGKYVHNKTPIKVKHIVCGNVYEATSGSLLKGHGCKKCADKLRGLKNRKTREELELEIGEKGKGEYVLVGDYKGDNKYIDVKHLVCDHVYKVTPSNFLSGYRCPICRESKGERKIRHWLEKNNILFQSQKEFNNLIGVKGGNLSYDFYLLKQNILIEYDGEYHFQVVHYNNEPKEVAQSRFDSQKIHDQRKNEYALNNNIYLLRIPYWDFDKVEEILNNLVINNFKQEDSNE